MRQMDTMKTIFTFVMLVLSFIILYLTRKHKNKKKSAFLVIGLVISALPLTYTLYDDYKNEYIGANIGLGLAFLLTWVITGTVFLVAMIKLIRASR